MATYAAYRHIELDNIGYGKKRVLKPPGGGSSDIFGAGPEHGSPRRAIQNATPSQLGSALYGNGNDQLDSNGVLSAASSNGGSSTPESPRSQSSASSNGKPGNDSYKRLFGPPEARPPSVASNNHMRSNITLGDDTNLCNRVIVTPQDSQNHHNKSTITNTNHCPVKSTNIETNGVKRPSEASLTDGAGGASTEGSVVVTNGNANGHLHTNDVVGSGNPVTGDGYDNPPTPRSQTNGTYSTGSTSGSEKSSTDSTPAGDTVFRMKNRIPPGGFSSGLW